MSIGAGAIRAGLAVVELSADLGPLDAALNIAASRVKGFAGKLTKLGAGIGGLGVSIVAPIAAAFKSAVDDAAAMGTLALQLSTTTEKASALAYALGTVGISEGELVGFARHLNSAFASAADGSTEAAQGFARIGLNWQELAKMPLEERLLAVKDALGQITNDFDRSSQAAHYFGRRGLELLKLPAAELRKRMAEAGNIGAVVTQEQAAHAKEVQRAWAQIGSSIKYAFVEIGRALLPHAADMKRYAASVVNIARTVREWVGANKPLVTTVLALGAALTGAGAALVALGVIGASVAGVLAGIGSAMGVVFSPIGLKIALVIAALALVAGGLYLVATRTEAGRSAVRALTPAFQEMASEGVKAWTVIRDTALESWEGIASALKRGDLQAAWEILAAGAMVAWEQIKASFLSIWYTLRDTFLSIWDKALAGWKMAFFIVMGGIARAFVGLMSIITRPIANLAERLSKTKAAKLSKTSGTLSDLASAFRKGDAATKEEIEGWTDTKIQEAKDAVEAAASRRRGASKEARAENDKAVKEARARLRELLEEERKKAGATAKGKGGAGEGLGGPGLQQAAREVRGSFGSTLGTSASYQQAFAVGSTSVQRQLVDQSKQTNNLLTQIRDKVEGPPVIG